MAVYLPQEVGAGPSATQLGWLERELEVQMKDSLKESQAMRLTFQNELGCARKDAERRLAEHNRHAKKEKAKWMAHVSCVEQDNADTSRHAQLLEEKLIVSTRKLCLATDKIHHLEAEAQAMRSRPPVVVERADPGTVAEAVRLRDRATGLAEEVKRAQRAAAESREAVGRESAINQGLQRDVNNARHRLLTVQGSFAESVEENAGLKRELEAERIKTAAGSRRLADAVERQDVALAEIRRDSGQLRDQRDSLAQDCAVLGIKLHQLNRKAAARSVLHALVRMQHASMARAVRIWVVGTTNDIHSKKQARRQEEHSSQIKSLEADLLGAEIRCREERRRSAALRDSREQVVESAITAAKLRGGVARAAQDRGFPALQWCFWGWARVARGGVVSMASRERRVELEKELERVREKVHVAEAELVHHRAAAERRRAEIEEGKQELENTLAALDAARSMASASKNRVTFLGTERVNAVLERNRRNRVALAFARWVDTRRTFERPPAKCASPGILSGRRVSSTTPMQPETDAAEANSSIMPSFDGPEVVSASSKDDVSAPIVVSETQGVISPDVGEGDPIETSATQVCNAKAQSPAPSVKGSVTDEQETNFDVGTQTRASSRRSSSRSGLCATTPSLAGEVAAEWTGEEIDEEEHFKDGTPQRGASVSLRSGERSFLSTKVSRDSERAGNGVVDRNSSSSNNSSSSSASVCSSDVPDLPRLMLHLRTAVGEELYAVGERLLRCVEADHREIHGRPYHPVSLTDAERDQFRACLEDAVRGSLRLAVVAFLQAQDSYRAMAVEREREKQAGWVRKEGGGRGGRGRRSNGGGESWSTDASVACRGVRNAQQVTEKDDRERNMDVSSLVTGPSSTPAEKARAARVLRDRLVGLLEDADEVWGKRRQPWGTLHAGMAARGNRNKTEVTMKRGSASRAGSGPDRSSSSWRMCSLDSGAGPRKLWEAVAGPKFIEAGWKIDGQALEQSVWDLAVLVRDQDRGQKVPLRRCERLRRVLDLRIYELLLLHVRTRLLWDGIRADYGTVAGVNGGTDITVWAELEGRSSKKKKSISKKK